MTEVEGEEPFEGWERLGQAITNGERMPTLLQLGLVVCLALLLRLVGVDQGAEVSMLPYQVVAIDAPTHLDGGKWKSLFCFRYSTRE